MFRSAPSIIAFLAAGDGSPGVNPSAGSGCTWTDAPGSSGSVGGASGAGSAAVPVPWSPAALGGGLVGVSTAASAAAFFSAWLFRAASCVCGLSDTAGTSSTMTATELVWLEPGFLERRISHARRRHCPSTCSDWAASVTSVHWRFGANAFRSHDSNDMCTGVKSSRAWIRMRSATSGLS